MMFEPLYNLINPIGKRIKNAFIFLQTQTGFKELSGPEKHFKGSLIEYFNGKYWIVIYNDVRESYLEIAIYKYDHLTNKLIMGEHGEYIVRISDMLKEIAPGNTDKMFNNYEVNEVNDVIKRCESLLIEYLRRHPEIV